MPRLAIVALAAAAGCAHHYGYQVAAADLVGYEVARAGDEHDVRAVEIAGYAALIAGAPAVHAAHGNWGRAGISLGLRAAFAGIACATDIDPDEGTGDEGPAIRGMFTGLMLVAGALAIEAVDSLALAYDPGSEPEPTPRVLTLGGSF